MLVFCRGRKIGVPGEKPLGTRTRTNNKLNPHMTPRPRIETGSRWWELSALTTSPDYLIIGTIWSKRMLLLYMTMPFSVSSKRLKRKKKKTKIKVFISTGDIGGNFLQNILKKQILVPGGWFFVT